MKNVKLQRRVIFGSLLWDRPGEGLHLKPVFDNHSIAEWPECAEAYVQSNEDWTLLRKAHGEIPLTAEEEARARKLQEFRDQARAARALGMPVTIPVGSLSDG